MSEQIKTPFGHHLSYASLEILQSCARQARADLEKLHWRVVSFDNKNFAGKEGGIYDEIRDESKKIEKAVEELNSIYVFLLTGSKEEKGTKPAQPVSSPPDVQETNGYDTFLEDAKNRLKELWESRGGERIRENEMSAIVALLDQWFHEKR